MVGGINLQARIGRLESWTGPGRGARITKWKDFNGSGRGRSTKCSCDVSMSAWNGAWNSLLYAAHIMFLLSASWHSATLSSSLFTLCLWLNCIFHCWSCSHYACVLRLQWSVDTFNQRALKGNFKEFLTFHYFQFNQEKNLWSYFRTLSKLAKYQLCTHSLLQRLGEAFYPKLSKPALAGRLQEGSKQGPKQLGAVLKQVLGPPKATKLTRKSKSWYTSLISSRNYHRSNLFSQWSL